MDAKTADLRCAADWKQDKRLRLTGATAVIAHDAPSELAHRRLVQGGRPEMPEAQRLVSTLLVQGDRWRLTTDEATFRVITTGGEVDGVAGFERKQRREARPVVALHVEPQRRFDCLA